MYFFANRPGEGYESSARTAPAYGTWLVRDVNPGATGSHPEGMTDLNGRLLFTAHDGAGGPCGLGGGSRQPAPSAARPTCTRPT